MFFIVVACVGVCRQDEKQKHTTQMTYNCGIIVSKNIGANVKRRALIG